MWGIYGKCEKFKIHDFFSLVTSERNFINFVKSVFFCSYWYTGLLIWDTFSDHKHCDNYYRWNVYLLKVKQIFNYKIHEFSLIFSYSWIVYAGTNEDYKRKMAWIFAKYRFQIRINYLLVAIHRKRKFFFKFERRNRHFLNFFVEFPSFSYRHNFSISGDSWGIFVIL